MSEVKHQYAFQKLSPHGNEHEGNLERNSTIITDGSGKPVVLTYGKYRELIGQGQEAVETWIEEQGFVFEEEAEAEPEDEEGDLGAPAEPGASDGAPDVAPEGGDPSSTPRGSGRSRSRKRS